VLSAIVDVVLAQATFEAEPWALMGGVVAVIK